MGSGSTLTDGVLLVCGPSCPKLAGSPKCFRALRDLPEPETRACAGACCGGQAQKQGQGRRVASPEVVSSGRCHSGRRGQPPAGDLCKAGRGHLPRTEKGFAHQRSSPVVKGGRRGVNSITRPVTRLGLCRRRGWGHRAESQRHHGPGAQNREGGRWAAGRARVGSRRHAAGCHRKRCHKRSGKERVWGRAVCAAVRLALA